MNDTDRVIVPGYEPVLDTGFDRPAPTHTERELTRILRDAHSNPNDQGRLT